MNAELSRRAAWALRFMRLSLTELRTFTAIVEAARTFDDLPKAFQDLILEVERVNGTREDFQ